MEVWQSVYNDVAYSKVLSKGYDQWENLWSGVVRVCSRYMSQARHAQHFVIVFPVDYGNLTCGGYPGSGGNLQLDMQVC